MKKLSVQLAHLRERFEVAPVRKAELAIVDHIEKQAWKNKTPGANKALALDVHQLALDYGIGFALDALQVAEPKALANQIARFMCIEVARAGLDNHPHMERALPRDSLDKLSACIAKNGDLTDWEGWAARLRDGYRRSQDEVYDRLYSRFVAPLHGRDYDGDWALGGLSGLLDAADDLCFLLIRADERYLAAQQIADLAKALETRWQNGTRLEFEFIDDIEAAMEALEERLTPQHQRNALGCLWAAWVFHTRGETVHPKPLAPRFDLTQTAGQPE